MQDLVLNPVATHVYNSPSGKDVFDKRYEPIVGNVVCMAVYYNEDMEMDFRGFETEAEIEMAHAAFDTILEQYKVNERDIKKRFSDPKSLGLNNYSVEFTSFDNSNDFFDFMASHFSNDER